MIVQFEPSKHYEVYTSISYICAYIYFFLFYKKQTFTERNPYIRTRYTHTHRERKNDLKKWNLTQSILNLPYRYICIY